MDAFVGCVVSLSTPYYFRTGDYPPIPNSVVKMERSNDRDERTRKRRRLDSRKRSSHRTQSRSRVLDYRDLFRCICAYLGVIYNFYGANYHVGLCIRWILGWALVGYGRPNVLWRSKKGPTSPRYLAIQLYCHGPYKTAHNAFREAS